jgi:intergrase/recombinase
MGSIRSRSKREELHGNTVGDLCTYFLEQHAKRREKSWQENERRCYRHIIPTLGRHLVKTVSRADIATLHRRIGTKSPYETNRVLALLSVMFEFAIKQGLRDEAAGNPARRIDKYPEQKRDRWVTPAELHLLVAAIKCQTSLYVRTALWLYLLTGARKNEVLRIRAVITTFVSS